MGGLALQLYSLFVVYFCVVMVYDDRCASGLMHGRSGDCFGWCSSGIIYLFLETGTLTGLKVHQSAELAGQRVEPPVSASRVAITGMVSMNLCTWLFFMGIQTQVGPHTLG